MQRNGHRTPPVPHKAGVKYLGGVKKCQPCRKSTVETATAGLSSDESGESSGKMRGLLPFQAAFVAAITRQNRPPSIAASECTPEGEREISMACAGS